MNDLYGTLKEIVLESYNIKTLSITKIQKSYTNKNYLSNSEHDKKYIIRLSPLYRINHLWFEIYVLNKLKSFELPFEIPRLIMTQNGSFAVRIKDHIITMFDFIESREVSSGDKTRELHKFSSFLGEKIGILHKTFMQIKIPYTNFTHFNLIDSYDNKFRFYKICNYSPHDEWRKILLPYMKIIFEEISKYKKYYTHFSNPELIHTDLRIDNFIIRNNKITGIVDFDDIVMGDHAFDLASILIEDYTDKKVLSDDVSEMMTNIEDFLILLQKYSEIQKNIFRKDFLNRLINLLNLQCLQVLSIVGRDIDFNENDRIKNAVWYSNFIKIMNDKKNIEWIKNSLYGKL